MKIAVAVLSLCVMITTIISALLWRDNALLLQQMATSKLVKPEEMAAVAGACHDLVSTNRQCLAFSKRVKEMLDVEKGSQQDALWTALWDGTDEVRRGTGGSDQGSPGR